MVIGAVDIKGFEKQYRATLISSITGYKAANMVGTISADGFLNLAVFSSVVHVGSNPPLIGIITRPVENERHTYQNILNSGFYTVNAISHSMHERAHQTSARYPVEVSEFEACSFKAAFHNGFLAPFVEESPLKLACSLQEEIHIRSNNTRMLVGSIESIHLDEHLLGSDGYIHLDKADIVAISSLDGYNRVAPPDRYQYAKPYAKSAKL